MKLKLLQIWCSNLFELNRILETFLESISNLVDYSFNELV